MNETAKRDAINLDTQIIDELNRTTCPEESTGSINSPLAEPEVTRREETSKRELLQNQFPTD